MSIIQRLLERTADKSHARGICLAFLGDSVTQGCFEIYPSSEGGILTVTEAHHAYAHHVLRQLCMRFPDTPFHLIHAGRSGDRAPGGLRRLQRDVLSFHPDLTVVCYGLNDCSDAADSIETYVGALRDIFTQLQKADSEVVFMTPNTMSFYVCPTLTEPAILSIAKCKTAYQTSGLFDRHIEAARSLCHDMGIPVCDCYACWQALRESGVDVTKRLSNRINHPTRDMHTLFADELVKTMLEGGG